MYFKKPLLINRYAIFVRDIEPKGFDLVVMDGFLTWSDVGRVRQLQADPEAQRQMVAHNYEVARRHCSDAVLKRSLNTLVINFFGMDI